MSDPITPEQVAALRALLAEAPSGLCYDEADEDACCPHGYTQEAACPSEVALDRWESHFTAMVFDALPALLDAATERDAQIASLRAGLIRGGNVIAWVAEHAHRDEVRADDEIAALRAERDALIAELRMRAVAEGGGV